MIRLVRRSVVFLLVLLARGYQVGIAPLLLGTCKFVPSCSDYFIQAVHEWGPLRGGWMGLRRIWRCRPLTAGGIDPVPKRGGPSCTR